MSLTFRRAALACFAAAAIAIPVVLLTLHDPRAHTSAGPDQSRPDKTKTAFDTVPPNAERLLGSLDDAPPIVFAANDDGAYRLYGIQLDGSGRRALTSGRGLYPAWSGDGSRLAYVGETNGTSATYAAVKFALPDGTISTVTSGSRVPARPTFNGNEIYFESHIQTSNGAAGSISASSTIDAVDVERRKQRTVVSAGAAYHPAWNRDGTRLAFIQAASCESTVIACPQTLRVEVGGQVTEPTPAAAVAANPAWSSGDDLAYIQYDGTASHVWILGLDGLARQITHGPVQDHDPTWSPDQRAIAFTRECDIWIQSLDGGEALRITNTPNTCELAPSWRPSGVLPR